MITTQTPVSYDLGTDWMWRLPGTAPWGPQYQSALVDLLRRLDATIIAEKAARLPAAESCFSRERQCARVSAFLRELMDGGAP